jgi:hypothetical protein
METVRAEGSLVASLAELKRIEQQRIADERAAMQRAVDERKAAQEEAERREREAAEAKAKAELAAKIAAEEAKAAAEREARMRVQAAEAAEYARAQAQLEQQRFAVEAELRREEVARKRPTWMLVVTAAAMVVAAVLAWAALRWKEQADQATRDSNAAIADKKVAQDRANRALSTLAEIESELAQYAVRVDEAVRQVAIAKSKADAEAAQAKLAMAQREQQKLKEKQRREKQELEDAIRRGGAQVDPACLKNPLCTKP